MIIGLRFQGAIGDLILASCFFKKILNQYKNCKFKVIFNYGGGKDRINVLYNLLPKEIKDNIIEWTIENRYCVRPITLPEKRFFYDCHNWFDFWYQNMHDKFNNKLIPNPEDKPFLDVEISNEKKYKLGIFRYTNWHIHLNTNRNLDNNTWYSILKNVWNNDKICLLGQHDPYEFSNKWNVFVDTLNLKETLKKVTECEYFIGCVSGITFFSQFYCKKSYWITHSERISEHKKWWIIRPNIVTLLYTNKRYNVPR